MSDSSTPLPGADRLEAASPVQETKEPPKSRTLAEFLESTPPNVEMPISDLASPRRNYNNTYMQMEAPDIQLHCPSTVCNGVRIFKCLSSAPTLEKGWKHVFIYYRCRNCETTAKTFALAVRLLSDRSSEGLVRKFGELPAFGPHVPSRVIMLIGPDRDLFLHGRTAENLGLGIGAFAYYRRVVENQKGRIIRELGKAAKTARRLRRPPQTVRGSCK